MDEVEVAESFRKNFCRVTKNVNRPDIWCSKTLLQVGNAQVSVHSGCVPNSSEGQDLTREIFHFFEKKMALFKAFPCGSYSVQSSGVPGAFAESSPASAGQVYGQGLGKQQSVNVCEHQVQAFLSFCEEFKVNKKGFFEPSQRTNYFHIRHSPKSAFCFIACVPEQLKIDYCKKHSRYCWPFEALTVLLRRGWGGAAQPVRRGWGPLSCPALRRGGSGRPGCSPQRPEQGKRRGRRLALLLGTGDSTELHQGRLSLGMRTHFSATRWSDTEQAS